MFLENYDKGAPWRMIDKGRSVFHKTVSLSLLLIVVVVVTVIVMIIIVVIMTNIIIIIIIVIIILKHTLKQDRIW